MSDEPVPQPGPVSFEINRERFDLVLSEFRELHRFYVEDSKKAVDLATDANKQISAFFERIMFLALGTIGISVSAVTSFASRFAVAGFHKYSTVVVLSIAWFLLFGSAASCRIVMLSTIAANKSFLKDWNELMTHFHGCWTKITLVRMGGTVKGSVLVDGAPADLGASIASLGSEISPDDLNARIEQLRASIAERTSPSKGGEGATALHMLHFGLLLLGIVAVYFVSMLK